MHPCTEWFAPPALAPSDQTVGSLGALTKMYQMQNSPVFGQIATDMIADTESVDCAFVDELFARAFKHGKLLKRCTESDQWKYVSYFLSFPK